MTSYRVTTSELAAIFGVTPRRVSQMVDEGLPRLPKGGHDLADACRWYCARLKNQAASTRGELAQGRARLATAKASREELELAARRGELIDAEAARMAVSNTTRRARDVLLAVPDRIAPLVVERTDTHEVHRILSDEVRRVCSEIAAIKLPGATGSS
jgi:phage terminase Nu1 subunit (DNA packaging protein)